MGLTFVAHFVTCGSHLLLFFLQTSFVGIQLYVDSNEGCLQMEVFEPTCVARKEKGKPILSFCLVVVLLPAMRAIITIDPDSFFPKDVFPAVANQEKSYTQFLLHQYFSNLKILNAIHCSQTVLTIRAPAVLTNFAIEPLFFGSLAKHGLVLQRQSFKLSFKSESSHII